MRRREAAPGDEQALDAERQQRAVGDAVDRGPAALAHVAPCRVAARAVVLDRRAAQRDLVGEAAPAEDVLAGQAVVAVDPAALPHADGRAGGHDHGSLEAGHAIAQEPVVLRDLAAALHLGCGQLPGSVASTLGIRVMWTRATPSYGVRCQEPSMRGRRYAPEAAASRHQPPQLRLGHGRCRRDVHVRDLEQRRQRLDRPAVARRVVRDAGHRAHVRVTRGVDERRRLHPALAALVPEADRGQAPVVHADAGRPRCGAAGRRPRPRPGAPRGP